MAGTVCGGGVGVDTKRVNAAVKIAIALDRKMKWGKALKLSKDLARLIEGMTTEEYNQYTKRTE